MSSTTLPGSFYGKKPGSHFINNALHFFSHILTLYKVFFLDINLKKLFLQQRFFVEDYFCDDKEDYFKFLIKFIIENSSINSSSAEFMFAYDNWQVVKLSWEETFCFHFVFKFFLKTVSMAFQDPSHFTKRKFLK